MKFFLINSPKYHVTNQLKNLKISLSAKSEYAILKEQASNSSGLQIIAFQLVVDFLKIFFFNPKI